MMPETHNKQQQLTPRELKVIEHYLNTGNLIEAVRIAGYKSKHPQTQAITGNRILKKYEALAGGREIFRASGLGEARLAEKLKRLIEHLEDRLYNREELAAASKLLKALEVASKCLGLHRDAFEGLAAPVIVIEGEPAQQSPDEGRPIVDVTAQIQALAVPQLSGPGAGGAEEGPDGNPGDNGEVAFEIYTAGGDE